MDGISLFFVTATDRKKSMIVSRLTGGLGNQLFQYALGRSLALRKNTVLRLDTRVYKSEQYTNYAYHQRKFKLRFFNASHQEARTVDFLKFAYLQRFGFATYMETGLSFQRAVLEVPGDNVYLSGFWQSEKYFESCAQEIKTDLTITKPLDDAYSEYREHIAKSNAVVLHVRRGDLIMNDAIHEKHGACDVGYYARSIKFVSDRVADIRIFVFSDDIEWCRQELHFSAPTTYVSVAHPIDIDELHLMTLGKHFVLSNSTFGWWGAWLSSSPSKLVIAPKRWFRDPTMNSDDIVPESWTKL